MADPIQTIIQTLRGHAGEMTARLVTAAVRNLRADNPKDTGFSSLNWIASVGTPFEGTAGTYEAAVLGILNAAPQQRGVREVVGQIKAGKLTQPIHIVNNVPYIRFLNEGSSSQAPSGWVQAALARAVREALTGG